MKTTTRFPLFLAFIIMFCSCNSPKQNNQNVSPDSTTQSYENQASGNATNEFFFAFASKNGDTLITMLVDTLDTSRSYFTSDRSGRILPLHFLLRQADPPANTGRQTHYNLPYLPGYLFALAGNLDVGQTAIIFTQEFLINRKPLSIVRHRILPPLDSEFIKRIESDRKLRVVRSWHSTTLGTNVIIGIAQFENRADTALASLALITPTLILYEDYIGDLSAGDAWRVDDGGKFAAETITVIQAFLNDGNIELLRTWGGPEGEHAAFLRQSGGTLSMVRDCYRYWMPE